MSGNRKTKYEAPKIKSIETRAKGSRWEPAICPDGVKIMLEKGTRVVSQTEKIARLNEELAEGRRRAAKIAKRVEELLVENQRAVAERNNLIERAGESENATRRLVAEAQKSREAIRFWRLATLAIAGCAILNAVWELVGI